MIFLLIKMHFHAAGIMISIIRDFFSIVHLLCPRDCYYMQPSRQHQSFYSLQKQALNCCYLLSVHMLGGRLNLNGDQDGTADSNLISLNTVQSAFHKSQRNQKSRRSKSMNFHKLSNIFIWRGCFIFHDFLLDFHAQLRAFVK